MADPFYVVAAANRCVDHVRRRVQNELLGHRGRKDDPLYKIRRVLLTGSERLNQRGVDRMALELRLGDPDDEVLGAWLAKEYLRDVYLTDDPDEAAVLLDRVITSHGPLFAAPARWQPGSSSKLRRPRCQRHSATSCRGPRCPRPGSCSPNPRAKRGP